jgi:trigger factor
MTFKIIVEIEPEFEVKNYKGLKIHKKEINVTEQEIDRYKNEILEKNAKFEIDEFDIVKEDSFVLIDYVEKIDGVEYTGGQGKGIFVSIKNSGFIEGFAAGLVGMKTGEIRDLKLKFPEDYKIKDLASKDVIFTVTIKKIKKKILPDLTDEFVQKLGMKDVKDFQEKIRQNIKIEKENKEQKEIEEQIVNQLIEKNDISIPKTMLKNEIERIKEKRKKCYEMYGCKDFDFSDMAEKFERDAKKNIKAYYILNAILKKESFLRATQEDFEKKLEKDITENKDKFKEIKDYYEKNKDRIMLSIEQDKLFNFLIDNAKK